MVTFYCREVQAELEEGDLKVPEETRSVLKLQDASFIVVNMFVRQSSAIFSWAEAIWEARPSITSVKINKVLKIRICNHS